MKTIQNLILLLSTLMLSSCVNFEGFGVAGSKNVTTESRTILSEFDKIEVSQGIDVLLTQGNSTTLTIEADDNLHKLLKTDVENNILKIYFSENVSTRKSSKVYLTTSHLSAIHTNSGASVEGQNTFKTEKMDLDASSGSDITLRIEAQDIFANSSSGSDISVVGTCQLFKANSSSGSDINASELKAADADADASSGSDIELYCTENFKGQASSGADITCTGSPKITTIDKSSGGSVHVN